MGQLWHVVRDGETEVDDAEEEKCAEADVV